jgi:CMP-N-acetylneuraminic acid synthetase
MKVLALIPARGGSKGIPRKNIVPIAGKPLLAWTIEAARNSKHLDRVILSTDDEEIASVGREFGVEVPFMRPAELARDTSGSLEMAMHALDWAAREPAGEPEYLLILQPTSPLRVSADIDAAIELALERRAEAVVGVRETFSPAHPYDIWRTESTGEMRYFLDTKDKPTRRQDYPPAYVSCGAIYLNRVITFRQTRNFHPSGTLAYHMPADRSIDIDTPLDLQIADFLLRQRLAQGSTVRATTETSY